MWRELKRLPHNLPHGTARPSIKGVLVDKGERFGAAWAFGAAKGYYGERFYWRGVSYDMLAGIGLTTASALLNAFTGGRSKLADHAERVGDAGVMSALVAIGAKWGMAKAGRTVAVITPGKNAGRLPRTTAMGAIPPAASGPYLSADEIANYAARR